MVCQYLKNLPFLMCCLLVGCATTSDSFKPSSSERSAFIEEPLGDEVTRVSIVIDVPNSFLWAFLSDNSKAHHWSVFFDQIRDLPSNPNVENVDGLGARRRCYRNQDARGYYWDEEVVHTIPGRLKRIYTFNVSNDTWPRSWFTEGAETYTDNIYTTIDENQTKFTFATVSLSTTNAITRGILLSDKHIDLLTEIFMLNMENIKAMAEAEFKSVTYERPHPYSETYFTGDLDSAVPPITSVTPGNLSRADHLKNLERYPVRLGSE